jgi:hypothetical protein
MFGMRDAGARRPGGDFRPSKPAGFYRIFTSTTNGMTVLSGRNLFRHTEIRGSTALAAFGLVTTPGFSTIFSTGVENFGDKPNQRAGQGRSRTREEDPRIYHSDPPGTIGELVDPAADN